MFHNFGFHQWNRPLTTRHLPVVTRTFTHPVVTGILVFIMVLVGLLLLAATVLVVPMIVR